MKGVGLVKTTCQLSSRFFGLESRPSDTSAQTHLPAGWGGGWQRGNNQAQPQDWMRLLCSQEQPNTFVPSASWESYSHISVPSLTTPSPHTGTVAA